MSHLKCIVLLIFLTTSVVCLDLVTLTNDGNIFPKNIAANLGESFMFRLIRLPQEFKDCTLVSPDLTKEFKIKEGENNGRIFHWDPTGKKSGCGVKILNATAADNGRWRLVANGGDSKKLQGISNVDVQETKPVPKRIEIPSGVPIVLDFGPSNVEYCRVKTPISLDEIRLEKNCTIHLDNVNKAVQGKYVATFGLKGEFQEVSLESELYVTDEELQVSSIHESAVSHLLCNLKHFSNKKLTTCRFVRESDGTAFHVSEGLGHGNYEYYGSGLAKGECGLTIRNPVGADLGPWKCSIGYETAKGKFSYYESYITSAVAKGGNEKDESQSEVIAAVGHPFVISCGLDARLSYCLFKNPAGETFTSHSGGTPEDDYWNPGSDLRGGKCSLAFKKANKTYSGEWTCQMGSLDQAMMDVTKKVSVRVGDTPLVALAKKFSASEGSSVTLKCRSVAVSKSLQYCRFTLPNGSGLNINEEVTKDKPIDGSLYYSGRGLKEGDCFVTIKAVSSKHFGKWTCAAATSASNVEAKDTLELVKSDEGTTMTAGAYAGIGIAIAFLISGGVFGVYWLRKRRLQGTPVETEGSRRSSEESGV